MKTDDVKVGMKVWIKDHWVSRSDSHALEMDRWLGQTMTVAHIDSFTNDIKMIEDAYENGGFGWYWRAEDFDPVIETEKKSTSKSTPLEAVLAAVTLDDVRAVIRQLSDKDFNRLLVQLEYDRRVESLQEITEKIRNYVTAFGSFWLKDIIDGDGRVSFRDIADAIEYEILHLERSVDE